jgi:hypothetical protein
MRPRNFVVILAVVFCAAALKSALAQNFISTGAVSGIRMYSPNAQDWWFNPQNNNLNLVVNGQTASPVVTVSTNGSVGLSTATASITHTLEVGGSINAQSIFVNGVAVSTSSGGGAVAYVGQTPVTAGTINGGGLGNANNYCASYFPGSRMCTTKDTWSLTPFPGNNCWIEPVLDFIGGVEVDAYYPPAVDGSAPTGSVSANGSIDCADWTDGVLSGSSDGNYGALWYNGAGGFTYTSCNDPLAYERAVCCCKP